MHPYPERLTDQVVLGNKTPQAAIVAVVSIIAHDEIMSFRYEHFAIDAITDVGISHNRMKRFIQLFDKDLAFGADPVATGGARHSVRVAQPLVQMLGLHVQWFTIYR